jgi:type VI secretion system protein ImpL
MNWLLIFFGLMLLGSIFFFWQWYTSDEEEHDGEDGFDAGSTTQMIGPDGETTLSETLMTTAAEGGARKSRMIALKESLEASLEVRGSAEDASAKDRLTLPWFLLIGGEASGKTTLLANTGLPLPYGPAFEVDSRKKDAGRWWLYEDAVVLEAPAALPGTTSVSTTLVPEQTQAVNTSEGWNTLLHMLRTERPDSPLNGIIITVSAQDLLSARVDPQKMTDQVERIRVFLQRTRDTLGVRLPLHLLVTKCDTLPGFKSFAHNLPQDRRNDIFGWANPSKVEAPFNPDWVDHGVAAMKSQLDGLRDELLAAPDEIVDADGLFVFVHEFGELHEPLKDFVVRLFEGNAKRPYLFLRGMYFSGDAIENVSPQDLADLKTSGARATVQISSEAVLGGQTKGHNLVFLKSLFRDKIFREAGLAKPVARFRLSRDRRVVIAQAAAVAFLAVGGGGLWTALNGYSSNGTLNPGLRHDAEAVTAMLAGMAIDIDEVKRGAGGPDTTLDRRLRDAAVIELVSEMRNVETIRKSAFIPASWFSPLPGEIRRSMISGIESIVLPVSRQRLQERIDRLVGDTAAVAEPRALTEYLNEVKTLSRHIAMYNTLASRDSGTVPQLATLLDYLYGERPLEGDSTYTSEDFREALKQASAARIVLTPDMVRSVLSRSVGLVATVARSSAQQLAPRNNAAAERGADPQQDLDALRGLRALVDLSDKQTGLVASVSDSAIFGLKLARIVEDSIAVELRSAGMRMWRDSLTPIEAEGRLRAFVKQLFQLRLMERPADATVIGEIAPQQRLRWDVGRLELVTSLRGEFDKALFVVATSFPNQAPDRMRRAFEVQLRARAIDAAATAQRFSPMGTVDSLELKASVANLDLAAPRILRAARVLDSLGAKDEGRRLVASATRHAEQALMLSQVLFEQARWFTPNTQAMARWNGVIPISHPAMGVVDNDNLKLVAAIAQNLQAVMGAARNATPAIRFLRRQGIDSVRTPRLLAEWDAISGAVDRLERGDLTSNSLAQLQTYIRDGMNSTDVASCAAAATVPDTGRAADALQLKRRQYRMAMAGRCADAGTQAVAAYQRLRTTFNARLAGRYPFVDSAAASTTDAEVGAIREVLRQYDGIVNAGLDYAMRADPRLQLSAQPAMAFLDRMAAVRAFFSTIADQERRPPEFFLVVGEGDLARTERWVYGEQIRVLATEADSTGMQPEVEITGPWAALRAARRTGIEPVRLFHPDTRAQLNLPNFPGLAPEITARR